MAKKNPEKVSAKVYNLIQLARDPFFYEQFELKRQLKACKDALAKARGNAPGGPVEEENE